MRFSEMVSRSLAARIESIIVVKDASTSGGTDEWSKVNKAPCNTRGSKTYETYRKRRLCYTVVKLNCVEVIVSMINRRGVSNSEC